MAIYHGKDGQNKLISNVFIGVNGVNKQVVKVLAGVNGVNKTVWKSNVIEMIEVENLIRNGDFSNGQTSWRTEGYFSAFDVINSVAVNKSLSSNKSIITNEYLTIPNGHKVYVKANYKIDTDIDVNNVSFLFGYVGGDGQIKTEFENHVGVFNEASAVSTWQNGKVLRLIYGFSGGAGTNTHGLYLDTMLLIDLTKDFGAGNEPTKEYIDEQLSKFDNNYFEGIAEIEKP